MTLTIEGSDRLRYGSTAALGAVGLVTTVALAKLKGSWPTVASTTLFAAALPLPMLIIQTPPPQEEQPPEEPRPSLQSLLASLELFGDRSQFVERLSEESSAPALLELYNGCNLTLAWTVRPFIELQLRRVCYSALLDRAPTEAEATIPQPDYPLLAPEFTSLDTPVPDAQLGTFAKQAPRELVMRVFPPQTLDARPDFPSGFTEVFAGTFDWTRENTGMPIWALIHSIESQKSTGPLPDQECETLIEELRQNPDLDIGLYLSFAESLEDESWDD